MSKKPGRAQGARAQTTEADAERLLQLEREVAGAQEESRRAGRRSNSLEQQLTAAVAQLEQAHIELHRRHETVRQKTRTLYLIEHRPA